MQTSLIYLFQKNKYKYILIIFAKNIHEKKVKNERMLKMLLIFIRSILLYIIVLIVMRLMGKREISQLQPFEFVISMIIANLATVPMEDARNSTFKWDCSHFRITLNAYDLVCN